MSRTRAAYASLYRRLPVPRSVAAVPRLPAEPLSRRFGLDRGRPVDRVFIERFVERHAGDIRGRVLEVYEDTYARRFGAATTVDVVDASGSNPHATLVGDLREPGWLPERAFDCVLLTQTLQAAPAPGAVLESLALALAPGGVLLASFAGISQRSDEDEAFHDLWRFTSDGVRALFVPTPLRAEVAAHGNLLASASFLYGLAEHEADPRAFASDDPQYELVVTARATLDS